MLNHQISLFHRIHLRPIQQAEVLYIAESDSGRIRQADLLTGALSFRRAKPRFCLENPMVPIFSHVDSPKKSYVVEEK